MANIKIKTSETMNQAPGGFGNENTLIRVPRLLRAILKLDIGQDLALTSVNGESVVLTVFPAYKIDATADDGYCYVTHEVFNLINTAPLKFNVKPVTTITLGCDPEFFLVDTQTKQLLRANAFFKKWGEVGHDGILAEIRPKPALQPQVLTNNIYDLIKQTRYLLDTNSVKYDSKRIMLYGASSFKTELKQQFMASSPVHATAGFHLHFGLPYQLLGMSLETGSLMYKLSNIMDYYVGIPSILLEQPTDYNRRLNTCISYGKPGDYRLDHRTFEYRVPGGSMLRHPTLTKGLIALGSVVVTDFVNKIKIATDNFNDISIANINSIMQKGLPLYTNLPNTNQLFGFICSPLLDSARAIVGDIFNNLSKMDTFEENVKELEAFFSLLNNTKQIHNNIEDNWRSVYESRHHVRESSDASYINGTTGCLLEAKSGTCT